MKTFLYFYVDCNKIRRGKRVTFWDFAATFSWQSSQTLFPFSISFRPWIVYPCLKTFGFLIRILNFCESFVENLKKFFSLENLRSCQKFQGKAYKNKWKEKQRKVAARSAYLKIVAVHNTSQTITFSTSVAARIGKLFPLIFLVFIFRGLLYSCEH